MTRFIKLIAAAIPLLAANLALGEITGSKHDFSAATWSDQEICKPCHTPHNADVSLTGRLWAHTMSTATYTYHGGSSTTVVDKTTSTNGSTGQALQSDMDAASRLCLSCHDGTVALDSFMGKNGGSTGVDISSLKTADGLYNPDLGGDGAIPDLSNDHPVGFKAVYDESSGASSGHYRYKPLADAKGKGLKFANTATAMATDYIYRTGAIVDPGTGTPVYETPTLTTNPYKVSVSCVTCHNVHNSGASEERGLLRISNQASDMCLTCHDK